MSGSVAYRGYCFLPMAYGIVISGFRLPSQPEGSYVVESTRIELASRCLQSTVAALEHATPCAGHPTPLDGPHRLCSCLLLCHV